MSGKIKAIRGSKERANKVIKWLTDKGLNPSDYGLKVICADDKGVSIVGGIEDQLSDNSKSAQEELQEKV